MKKVNGMTRVRKVQKLKGKARSKAKNEEL